MPTRNINLPPEQDRQDMMQAGKSQNVSEAMRDALQQRQKTDELQPEPLRTQIAAGLDALDRGAFIEVDDADPDAALDSLATPDAP
jgi:antitoxin ParD1/3/4